METAVAGDRIVVDSGHVGGGRREGEILEVISAQETRRYRVRWEDGKESIFVPGSDAHVEHIPLPAKSTGTDACVRFLVDAGVEYQLIPHASTDRAEEEAKTLGVPPSAVAKTVVLGTAGGYVRAVVPASDRLSLKKAREILEGGRDVQLLDEKALRTHYPMFELGAVPPFGGPTGDKVLIDRHIAKLDVTFVEAGKRTTSVELKAADLVAVTGGTVVDLVED